MPTENDVVIEAWNTVLFDKFSRFKHLLVDGLTNHSDGFFSRVPFDNGQSVIDIGCGFGDTSLRLSEMVGSKGRVLGVDCAERFVQASQELARESGRDNVEFLVADAQCDPLNGSFDRAFSRFGTMFFNLPGAALSNIRRHLRPGGRLDMIVWRRREDNPWLHDAELEVKKRVPVIEHSETNEVHCGPGPFSMAGPNMVSDLLLATGYTDVAFQRFDADICIGRDLNDAVAFAMDLGPAGEILRLAKAAGQDHSETIREVLTETLKTYQREDGIWAPSSTWFVSAQNPG